MSHWCVVVLGCTVMADGSPSDWLTDRLQATVAVVNGIFDLVKSKMQEHTVDIFLTGGAVKSEVTEASCMKRWLTACLTERHDFVVTGSHSSEGQKLEHKHCPVNIVLHEEAAAQDTLDNMVLTVRMILAGDEAASPVERFRQRFGSRIILVTSDFHLHRGITLLSREVAFQLGPAEGDDGVTATKVNLWEIDADGLVCILTKHHGDGQPTILGVGALTPTLVGDALLARQEREIMLITEDSHRQALLHH